MCREDLTQGVLFQTFLDLAKLNIIGQKLCFQKILMFEMLPKLYTNL